jgi:hypothetical protein
VIYSAQVEKLLILWAAAQTGICDLEAVDAILLAGTNN